MNTTKGFLIPESLFNDSNLSFTEMILLTFVIQNGEYTNKELSEKTRLSEGRTANMISDLKKRGYLVQISFDGRYRVLMITKNN